MPTPVQIKRVGIAVLLGTVALVGNLTFDWLTHAKPEPVELIGASIIGVVLALGFCTSNRKA
jgi:hypothetical protein